MLGLNLAVATIGGSVSMMFSDLPKIREDRHSCVMIGCLIQFFYAEAGFLTMALGHACFKAITAGRIWLNI